MVFINSGRWESLERWSSTAFLVGVVMFIITAGFNLVDVLGGAGHTRLPLKQSFIGAGWTAGLVGLLGLYPRLADRSGRLADAGAVFTVIGIVGYAAMGIVALAFYLGIPGGEFESVALYFLPGVLIGTLLTFPLFSVASLRTGVYSRTLSLLLLGPPILFVVNMLTPTPPSVVVGIVSGLAAVHFAVGYLLRTGAPPADRPDPAAASSTD